MFLNSFLVSQSDFHLYLMGRLFLVLNSLFVHLFIDFIYWLVYTSAFFYVVWIIG